MLSRNRDEIVTMVCWSLLEKKNPGIGKLPGKKNKNKLEMIDTNNRFENVKKLTSFLVTSTRNFRRCSSNNNSQSNSYQTSEERKESLRFDLHFFFPKHRC